MKDEPKMPEEPKAKEPRKPHEWADQLNVDVGAYAAACIVRSWGQSAEQQLPVERADFEAGIKAALKVGAS